MLSDQEIAALIAAAEAVRIRAYAPYSRYRVAAAVLSSDDRVFTGVNVENASYGLSLCAERAAISSAVCHGMQRMKAVIIVTDADPPGTPCGACRQWMAEFGADNMEVIAANPQGVLLRYPLSELLPKAFRL